MKQLIVSSKWLFNHLADPDLVVLHASPSNNKTLGAERRDRQIKNARYFDIKHFSKTHSAFPNTLPSVSFFEEKCRKLGINQNSKIIVYDAHGVHTSPRVWWMFQTMGHQNIAVLNGGLPEWMKQGYAVKPMENKNYIRGNFKGELQKERLKGFDFVRANVDTQDALLIDARSSGRFEGTAPEPRVGLRSGHIPHSLNIPYQRVLENGCFKSKVELAKVFSDPQLYQKPLVFSCGSGITACIVLLASELLFDSEKSVYDGSWTEWVQLND